VIPVPMEGRRNVCAVQSDARVIERNAAGYRHTDEYIATADHVWSSRQRGELEGLRRLGRYPDRDGEERGSHDQRDRQKPAQGYLTERARHVIKGYLHRRFL